MQQFNLDESFSVQYCSSMMPGCVCKQSGITLISLTMRSLSSTVPAYKSDAAMKQAAMEIEPMQGPFAPESKTLTVSRCFFSEDYA